MGDCLGIPRPLSRAHFFYGVRSPPKVKVVYQFFANNIDLLYSTIDPRVHQLSKVPTCKLDFVLCDALSSHGRIPSHTDVSGVRGDFSGLFTTRDVRLLFDLLAKRTQQSCALASSVSPS